MKLQTWVNSRSLFCPFFWRYLQGRYLGGETFSLVIMLRLPIRWLWLGSTCTLQQQQVVGAVWTKLKKKLLECYRLKLQFTALKRRGNALSHFFSRHIKRVIHNTHSKHGSWGKKHRHAAIMKIIHMLEIICLYSKNQLWFEDSQDYRSL